MKKTRYFKYHKKFNDLSLLFDRSLFKNAEIVLIKLSENKKPRLYFVQSVTKKNRSGCDGVVGSFDLPMGFRIPNMSEEIEQKTFIKYTGEN